MKKRLPALVACLLCVPGAKAGEVFLHVDPATGSGIYVLKQGNTVAKIAPDFGANVFSIEVEGIEFLFQPDDIYAPSDSVFGNPVLYPTPNRVRNGVF